jgi:hypothetical protein
VVNSVKKGLSRSETRLEDARGTSIMDVDDGALLNSP